MITSKEIREYFSYNSDTGELIRKKRLSNRCKIGEVVGSLSRLGGSSKSYLRAKIKGKSYCVHRLVWLYHHGEFPVLDIDHINGNGLDNRIENLRQVTKFQNGQNNRRRADNKSGCTGVIWFKPRSTWCAYIRHNNKRIHLGYFKDKDDAIKARKQAERDLGFHQNHGKDRPIY